MNRYTLILTFLSCLFLLSGCDSGVNSETVDHSELIERDGLYYKKVYVPYTGKTVGKQQGSYKKGKRVGESVWYHENGQLKLKGTYKNGKREGKAINYHPNGNVASTGTHKNGKAEGEWVFYHENGQVRSKSIFKNGKKIRD